MCGLTMAVLALIFAGCNKTDDSNNGGGNNDVDDTYAYVDLDLPSGTLWATCNVGAETPEGYGDHFAWGETQPKNDYSWATYKYCEGDKNHLTKYCNVAEYGNNGFTDNLFFLQPTDDAASVNWGGKWRTPTCAEWDELFRNCNHEIAEVNGVKGLLFSSKSNRNTIFLPASGYYEGDELKGAGQSGHYWLSDLYKMSYPFDAYFLIFSVNDYINTNYGIRDLGRSVRPVRSVK